MKKLISFIFFLICGLILVGCEMEDMPIEDDSKITLVEAEVVIKTSGGTYSMYPEHQEWLSGVGTHERGSNITLTVNIPEDSHYIFVGWYATNEDFWKGRAVCLEPTYTFKAELDYYTGIIARVEPLPTVRLDYACTGMGKVEGYDNGEFTVGVPKTLYAFPFLGYIFEGWYVDNKLLSNDDIFDFVAEEGMKVLQPNFVIDPRLKNYRINSFEFECIIADVIDKTIKEATIPNIVTSIGYSAFSDCIDLEKINLPDRLESINSYAFRNCDSLTSIVLPRYIESIGSDAFFGCDSLTDIYYKGTLRNWLDVKLEYNPLGTHDLMFLDKNGEIEYEGSKYTKYEELIIPSTVSSIGDYQFYGFGNITSVIIPIYVEEIGKSAFHNCYSLEKVFYEGTIDEWQEINIDSTNDSLLDSAIYYYSGTEPTESGNYWHYVNKVPTIWS